MGVDVRFPVGYTKQQVEENLRKATEPYGLRVERHTDLPALYTDPDSPLVKTLLRAYREVTGDETTGPLVTGGATFARSMDNIVAFGAALPGAPDTEHQPNEGTAVEDIKMAMGIYCRAFQLLAFGQQA